MGSSAPLREWNCWGLWSCSGSYVVAFLPGCFSSLHLLMIKEQGLGMKRWRVEEMKCQKASRGEGSTGSPCFPDCYWHYWEELAKNGFFLSFSSHLLLQINKSVRGRNRNQSKMKRSGNRVIHDHPFPQRSRTIYGWFGGWESERSQRGLDLPHSINHALSVFMGRGIDKEYGCSIYYCIVTGHPKLSCLKQ